MRRSVFLLLFPLMFCLPGHATDSRCPDFLAQPDAPEPEYRHEFIFSPYTIHWSHNPEHKHVYLAGINEQLPGGRLCGISVFSNSFGQPSAYAYVGQQFDQVLGQPQLFAKITAGILYGYVGKYQNKVPYNNHGFSPGLIPSIGYKLTRQDALQVMVLGTAGVMFSYSRQF